MRALEVRRAIFSIAAAALAGFTLFVVSMPAMAQGTLGVVLMHGKDSTPGKSTGLRDIASKLESSGAKVAVPTMPWSSFGWTHISMTVEDAFAQIDAEIEKLRSKGAQRFVVGGQSLGANMALSYAVARGNVVGVVMIAPGHQPCGFYQRNKKIHEAVDQASELVKAGKGGESFRGPDENQNDTLMLSTTAAIYVSWMVPKGLASMPIMAPKLPPTIPVMVAISRDDPEFGMVEAYIFKPAAKNPYSKYVVVGGSHQTTDLAASLQVAEWIKGPPAQ